MELRPRLDGVFGPCQPGTRRLIPDASQHMESHRAHPGPIASSLDQKLKESPILVFALHFGLRAVFGTAATIAFRMPQRIAYLHIPQYLHTGSRLSKRRSVVSGGFFMIGRMRGQAKG